MSVVVLLEEETLAVVVLIALLLAMSDRLAIVVLSTVNWVTSAVSGAAGVSQRDLAIGWAIAVEIHRCVTAVARFFSCCTPWMGSIGLLGV